jgi:hypothetical protein
MGRTSRCVGRSLYNHLKQCNIHCDVEYEFDKVALVWNGRLTVFGTTYQVTGKQSKTEVLDTLMEHANSFIQSNLSAKKISS